MPKAGYAEAGGGLRFSRRRRVFLWQSQGLSNFFLLCETDRRSRYFPAQTPAISEHGAYASFQKFEGSFFCLKRKCGEVFTDYACTPGGGRDGRARSISQTRP